jgi:hypothetical protein
MAKQRTTKTKRMKRVTKPAGAKAKAKKPKAKKAKAKKPKAKKPKAGQAGTSYLSWIDAYSPEHAYLPEPIPEST